MTLLGCLAAIRYRVEILRLVLSFFLSGPNLADSDDR